MSAQSYLPIIKGQKTPCYDKCRVVNKCRANDLDSLTSEKEKKTGRMTNTWCGFHPGYETELETHTDRQTDMRGGERVSGGWERENSRK